MDENQWDDDSDSQVSDENTSPENSDSELDNVSVSSSEDSDTNNDSEPGHENAQHSALIYSRYDLLTTAPSRERAYLRSRPGICAGLSLAWLQLIVRDDVPPSNSWPTVSFARQLQEYIEDNSIRHQYFPEVAYMADQGRIRFDDVDEALQYLWLNAGSYIVLIRPRHARVGHAVAYSDRYSFPRGYLMNPNKGSHCCYTYEGLSEEFRSDRFILRSEYSRHGPEIIIIRIGKPDGTEQISWYANEDIHQNHEAQEYIQYGV